MTDLALLEKTIKESGMTITAIAEKIGITRVTLYNRLNGIGEFTGPEIVKISEVLHLSKKERDKIFLTKKVN